MINGDFDIYMEQDRILGENIKATGFCLVKDRNHGHSIFTETAAIGYAELYICAPWAPEHHLGQI